MKKYILIPLFLMLWVSAAAAEQAGGAGTTGAKQTDSSEPAFEGSFSPGYWGVRHEGNNDIAGEYDYLKSSAAGSFALEWDLLPHRFVFESSALNQKDYFAEMDYSYRDVVVFNGYTRGVFHNLNHYSFGLDNPATLSPSFTDKNPNDLYSIENALTRYFIRFKTPDFPFHLFAEVRELERNGTIQQRFLRFTGGLDKVSQSREIDWNTQEVKVGVNSHLGPLEAEYSHTDKKFEATGEKRLFDTFTSPAASIPHNFIPDLQSSSDTIKLHTSYSGRLAMAGAYTNGDKKNEDSGASVKFTNAAGDLTYMPWTSVLMSLKYRHYETDATNPNTVNNVTLSGTTVVNVRDSISSTRDTVNGTIRYRATDRLTLRGEYATETTDRTRGTLNTTVPAPLAGSPAFWNLPESTTKNTARLGLIYNVMKKVTFRADYSSTKVDNPAYDTDPDSASAARASISWLPTARTSTMLSYSLARETRDQLGAPLGGGSRDTSRDQGLASFTAMVGNRSSITASYSYFKNKVEQTLTLPDGTGAFQFEPGVPYADIAHVGSLALTIAPVEGVNFTASAAKSYLRGTLDFAGNVPNTGGITQLSELKAIDTVYAAGIEIQHSKDVGSEIRYQLRKYDDQLDNTKDGTVKTVLATLSLKW